jgi:DNA-binding XRE family transcriptional regulator
MEVSIFFMLPLALLLLALVIFLITMFVKLMILVFKALRKYVNSGPQRKEEEVLRRSLGEVLKDHRTRCSMTQEFVAESLGVSRQAVSKWENGTADPSTSNLLKLAKLFGLSPEELIRSIQPDRD